MISPALQNNPPVCDDCRAQKSHFLGRYRDFLLSKETLITAINGVLLLSGGIVSVSGDPGSARWLYLCSAVIGGIPLFTLAGKAVFLRRDITAGLMASVAVIAAIIVGEFSAAALVVFMFSIGDWLENLTVARADQALQDLAKLIPPTVVVIREGRESVIPLEQVTIRDRVLVRSGERIAVDGVVVNGSGSVNQSAITGESMPVDKKCGDEVYAGTLNEVGAVEIQPTRIHQDTTLGQIVMLVQEARKTQAPVQRIANRYARYLVPITFSIALLVFVITGDIRRSITVLVVVCPCALVLATPTAVAAAIGNAAKRGILVKSGAAIEQVGKIDVVAFDKTGTLTHGRPVIQGIIALDGLREEDLLAWAVAAERFSEHPIGRSIVQAGWDCQVRKIEAREFTPLPGYGISARVESRQIVIGNRALLAEQGIGWPEEMEERIKSLESQGQTVIPMAVDHRLAGFFLLTDTPRVEAKKAIEDLKRVGVKEVAMITGDNPRAANRIGRELGIDRLYAEVLPEEKLKIIRDLQSQGKRVCFVGDGVNDAPALAAADIGIAMGVAGTDVAMETAGIGLMADELDRIPQVMDLSRRSLQVIRQNVIFSMGMNLLSVLLGGFGIIGPAVGALMHEISALPVLANSARMIHYRGERHGN